MEDKSVISKIIKVPEREQKFCKTHKSIWGGCSWWCLYAIWQDKLSDRCEEEWIIVEG